jgi:hypothetical protein
VLAVALVAGVVVLGRPATMRRTPPPAAAAQAASTTPEITAELAPRKAAPRAATAAARPAPQPAAAPRSVGSVGSGPAMVTVFSRIPLDVYFEGKRIGTTDDGQLLVPPGAHRFELVSRRYAYRGDLTLTLEPGQMVTHTVSLPSGVLRVRGAAGTEVWVEGERIGALPIADVSVPIGTREVVFRHPQHGERRQVIEVGAAAPAEISATFGAAPTAEPSATPGPAAPAPAAAAAPPTPQRQAPPTPPRLAPLSAPRPRPSVQ